MTMGLAGALLVFGGIWRSFEWAVSGIGRDTRRLVPVGIVYLLLGYLIATLQFMPWAAWAALLASAAGLASAIGTRNTAQIRPWVTWSLILVDTGIVVALIAALLT